eukprot:UN04581
MASSAPNPRERQARMRRGQQERENSKDGDSGDESFSFTALESSPYERTSRQEKDEIIEEEFSFDHEDKPTVKLRKSEEFDETLLERP